MLRSLPISKWYYENTSEWTLDYPPFFAWFEFALGWGIKCVYTLNNLIEENMPKILEKLPVYSETPFNHLTIIPTIFKEFENIIRNTKEISWKTPLFMNLASLNDKSSETVLVMRLTVLLSELVLLYGLYKNSNFIAACVLFSPGLLIVDNIHFQYNGFLYGILFLSLGHISKGNYLSGAYLFTSLVNFKHIFIYYIPAFVVYYLRSYIEFKTIFRPLNFNAGRLLFTASAVLIVFAISLGPFQEHLNQIFIRLFPFKRGLTHAYWAPNFWALYSFLDRLLVKFYDVKNFNTLSRGLVGDVEFKFMPEITPMATLILTLMSMIPIMVKLWYKPTFQQFLASITLCGFSSYMFGWHVHEKAVLMIILPLSLMIEARPFQRFPWIYSLLCISGYYSLFPLLYESQEAMTRLFLYFPYVVILYHVLTKQEHEGFNFIEKSMIFGLIVSYFYNSLIHPAYFYAYEFLPLMITSVLCGVINVYCFIYLNIKMAILVEDLTKKDK